MRVNAFAAALAAAAVAGGAAVAADCIVTAAAAKIDGMAPTGETAVCLNLRRIQQVEAIDDYTLLVKSGGEYYLNRTNSRCNRAADRQAGFVYSTSGSQLCRNDIIRVVDNPSGMLNGTCTLGEFEKLGPAEEPA